MSGGRGMPAMAVHDPVYARALRLALRDEGILALDAEIARVHGSILGIADARRLQWRLKELREVRGLAIEAMVADPAATAPRVVAAGPAPGSAPGTAGEPPRLRIVEGGGRA